MSIYAPFDIEILDDPSYLALEAQNPAWPWWWLRIVQVAKRHNRRGRVCQADGRPMQARDLAIVHHRSVQREQEWAEMLQACCDLGLLEHVDGTYQITDWRRWHRAPSDEPEAIRDRVAKHRSSRDARDVTKSNGCNETATEQLQSSYRAAAGAAPLPPTGGSEAPAAPPAAAADVAVAPETELGPAPEPLYTGRPGPTSLETLRSIVGQAMQDLGLMGSPSGTWWTSVTAWAAPAIDDGATLDDIRDALRYAVGKAAYDRANRPWPYAMTIAAEELGNIAKRNQMRRDWEAGGRRGPEPRPYTFEPPTQPAPAPNGGGRHRRAPPGGMVPFGADHTPGGGAR
jgi:hypothetical protein